MGDDGVRVPYPFLPGLLDHTYLEGNLNLLFYSFAVLPSFLQVAALLHLLQKAFRDCSVLRPSLSPQYYVFFSAPEWEGNS